MLGNNKYNKRYFNKKIYQKLGLASLKSRCWFRKLCHFYKIFNEKSPSYLFNLIPNFNRIHNTRLSYNILPIKVGHDYFKNSFFPSPITERNKLDLIIRNTESANTFKKKLLKFKISKSLKILWNWLSANFSFAFCVFIKRQICQIFHIEDRILFAFLKILLKQT